MNLIVEIPDDIAGHLSVSGGDLARRALEAFALDEYERGHLTENALRRMLGLTRYELDGFLKAHTSGILRGASRHRRHGADKLPCPDRANHGPVSHRKSRGGIGGLKRAQAEAPAAHCGTNTASRPSARRHFEL